MIRLAWSRLRYRPARGLLATLPAAALGVLAAPTALFLVACLLYVPAAVVLGGGRAELRTLSWLGWPSRNLAGVVLAEYGLAGVLAGILAALAVMLGGTASDVGTAAGIALAVTLAAGMATAATTVSLVPSADRSRLS